MESQKFLIETQRLIIREMQQSDYDALCRILCDEEVMSAAYGSAFTPEEAQNWLNRHFKRYEDYGFGLWAVVLKETNEMIGQCGLTLQPWKDKELLEIGYLFQKAHWHKGYATEAAIACREYAFTVLNTDSVCSMIRDTHIASQKVAIRNGMKRTSLRFSFRNHPDRTLRGNPLPRLPRQKAYQPLRFCRGQSAAGTGIRPPARSHVFSGDHTAEGADDYTDYRLQWLAPGMDDGKNGGRLHPSRLDGPRGRESAALHGGGIRITMTDKTAK